MMTRRFSPFGVSSLSGWKVGVLGFQIPVITYAFPSAFLSMDSFKHKHKQ